MLEEMDEALRKLLIREMPIKKKEVEIKFNQPSREWSSRINRPTLNVFLHDLRENVSLRDLQPYWETLTDDNGTVVEKRKPARIDLHYLVTAWANEPEDEHRLLGRALFALYRHRRLPVDLMSKALRDSQKMPISLKVAQYDTLEKPSDIWNVMDNQQHVGINLRLTIAINPFLEITAPIVSTAKFEFGQSASPSSGEIDPGSEPDGSVSIRGTLITDEPMENLRMVLVDNNTDIPIRPDGMYAIRKLQPGEYTISISKVDNGGEPKIHKIQVPSLNYDIEL